MIMNRIRFLQKKFLTLSLLLLTTNCASIPKTDADFNSLIKSGQNGVKKDFLIKNVNLEEGKRRLQKFADKCLNRKLT